MTLEDNRSPVLFEALLPRLVNAYHRGLLVPFLGAGMSVSGDTGCPDWKSLVSALEKDARIPGSTEDDPPHLIRRANHAVRALARQRAGALAEAVHEALYTSQTQPSDATQELASIWWPLVVSTNYDDLFARAYCPSPSTAQAGPRDSFTRPSEGFLLKIRGRSIEDCESVLMSLRETHRSILWALHGFIPQNELHNYAGRSAARLASELVLGHEAYQRVAHASTHYRRAFAEVYRQRSFLFLGTSLSDVYLLGLFAEVQELYGPSPLPHYALVKKGDVDIDFLRSRFNILCIEYAGHPDLPDLLRQMASAINQPKASPSRWTFSSGNKSITHHLDIHAGPLPLQQARVSAAQSGGLAPSRGLVCFIFGAASDGEQEGPIGLPWYPYFGSALRETLEAAGLATILNAERQGRWRIASEALGIDELENYVFELPQQDHRQVEPYAVVSAWRRSDDGQSAERDARMISHATRAALIWAAARGFGHVHMPLLATGRGTHIAARYSLIEMIRGFARWAQTASEPLTLTIDVLNCSATFELASGRVDANELLSSPDTVRFWTELRGAQGDGSRQAGIERELMVLQTATKLSELATKASLDLKDWPATLNPSPTLVRQTFGIDAATLSLDEMGVVPGTTIRFTRSDSR